jgi:hypothetical protein
VGPRTGLDGCGKSHPTPGFDPWTLASRYTDYTIQAHENRRMVKINETLLTFISCMSVDAHSDLNVLLTLTE